MAGSSQYKNLWTIACGDGKPGEDEVASFPAPQDNHRRRTQGAEHPASSASGNNGRSSGQGDDTSSDEDSGRENVKGGSSESKETSRVQMNSCLICNTIFVTKKAHSEEEGLEGYQKLCSMLQVPVFEGFLAETNPFCAKCWDMIDEFFNLQRQIEGLLNTILELRDMLGKRLVETYDVTFASRKNYEVKAKIYEVWLQKVRNPNNDVTDFHEKFASIINSLNDPDAANRRSNLQSGSSRIPDSALPNRDTRDDDAASNNDSLHCPSPMSPPDMPDDIDDSNNEGTFGDQQVVRDSRSTKITSIAAEINPSPHTVQGPVLGTYMPTAPPPPPSDDMRLPVPIAASQMADRQESAIANGQPLRPQRPIIVTNRRIHPCRYCGKLFPSRFAMEMHERVHTGEKPFICRICGRGSASKAGMQKHEATHDNTRYEGEPEYECDLCGKKYHLERSLYTHMRDHAGITRLKKKKLRLPGQWPPKINYKKKKPKIDKEPKLLKPRPEFYFCEVCPEVDGEKLKYRHARSLKKHQKRYHSGVDRFVIRRRVKKVQLDKDGNPIREPTKYTTRKVDPLRKRRRFRMPRRTPGAPIELYSCSECGKQFKHYFNLEEHKRVHTGEKPFHCPKCEKRFAGKGNLDKHMKSHDATRFEGEPTHTCEFCGKGFYILGTLYHHRRKNHLGFADRYKKKKTQGDKKPRDCKICGKVYHSIGSLSHHKVIHGERKHKCPVCGKPFFYSKEASDHAKRHEPTWLYQFFFKYQCPACPPESLGFPSKLAVRGHWSQVHDTEKLPEMFRKIKIYKPPPPGPGQYECKLCPNVKDGKKKYRHYSSLRKHINLHHGGASSKRKFKSTKGRGSKKGEDDSLSEGDSTDESEYDFVNDENPTDVKPDIIQPARKSTRSTRGNISKLAHLLVDSESEDDIDGGVAPVLQCGNRERMGKPTGARTNTLPKPMSLKHTSSGNTGKQTKLTNAYIQEVLGGRELLIILSRCDLEGTTGKTSSSLSTIRKRKQDLTSTRSSSPNSCIPEITRIVSTAVAVRRRGQMNSLPSEITNLPSVVPGPDCISEAMQNSDDPLNTSPQLDVKEEVHPPGPRDEELEADIIQTQSVHNSLVRRSTLQPIFSFAIPNPLLRSGSSANSPAAPAKHEPTDGEEESVLGI